MNSCDNTCVERIHCGDPGLGVGGFGPYSLVAITEIVPGALSLGQLRHQTGLLRLARFRALVDSVTIGLSITSSLKYSVQSAIIEPHASPILDRMQVLQEAHRLGLRTYAMLCPIMPYAMDSVDELIDRAVEYGAEEFFAEAVNPRGRGLKHTERALRAAGFASEAQSVRDVRSKSKWSAYSVELLDALRAALDRHDRVNDLRYMLYPSSHDYESLRVARGLTDQRGIVWLGKDDPEADRMSSLTRYDRIIDNCSEAIRVASPEVGGTASDNCTRKGT